MPRLHIVFVDLLLRPVTQVHIRVLIRNLGVNKEVVLGADMRSAVVQNGGIAHPVENILFNRHPHREIVRIDALHTGFAFPDMVEVIPPDNRTPLLRRSAQIHVDSAEIRKGFADIIDVVVLHNLVVPEDQNAGMRGIVNFTMGNAVACSRQNHSRVIRFMVIGKIMDMAVLHHIIAWRKRQPVPAVQNDSRPSDMMDMRADNRMVNPCALGEVIVQPAALGIDPYAAFGEVADFAVHQPDTVAAHDDRPRIPPILQNQILKGDKRRI
ncbi:hypothetical protein D3C73_561740 [compost metagenome]